MAESRMAESGRAESGRAESGRAESGRAESGRAESGRAESGRAESGRAGIVCLLQTLQSMPHNGVVLLQLVIGEAIQRGMQLAFQCGDNLQVAGMQRGETGRDRQQ